MFGPPSGNLSLTLLLFSVWLSILADLASPPGASGHLGHLALPVTVMGRGGGLSAAAPAATGDADRASSPEGGEESASPGPPPPPDCSDPGPFSRCRFAEPGPPKRTLSSP